jgi:hypothetical protein
MHVLEYTCMNVRMICTYICMCDPYVSVCKHVRVEHLLLRADVCCTSTQPRHLSVRDTTRGCASMHTTRGCASMHTTRGCASMHTTRGCASMHTTRGCASICRHSTLCMRTPMQNLLQAPWYAYLRRDIAIYYRLLPSITVYYRLSTLEATQTSYSAHADSRTLSHLQRLRTRCCLFTQGRGR